MCTGNYKSDEYTKYTFFSFAVYKSAFDLKIAKEKVTDRRLYLLPFFKRSLYKIPLELFQF